MNSAMLKIIERERRQDRINSYIAAAIGWLAVGIGGLIGAGLFYLFCLLTLSIG